jgi:signal transduction histidine kinase
MRPAPLDLLRIVRACTDDAARGSRSHAIRLNAAVDRLEVIGDEPRLERVIRNMLDNAIKFSPDGGDIIVTASQDAEPTGAWAVVTIEDRGIGIPADDLEHVFDQFRRGANVAGRIHGSGIGLSGVQQVVAMHGGEIRVRSTEGAGSTFTLRLPIAPPAN